MYDQEQPSIPLEVRARQEKIFLTWKRQQGFQDKKTVKTSNIQPQPVTQFLGLAIAACMIAAGIGMLHAGIQADGIVDIKSAFVSGSMEADSAGLIIVFLGFVIVMASLYAPSPSKNAKKTEESTQIAKFLNWTSQNQKILFGLVLIGLLGSVMTITGQFGMIGIIAVVSGTLIRHLTS